MPLSHPSIFFIACLYFYSLYGTLLFPKNRIITVLPRTYNFTILSSTEKKNFFLLQYSNPKIIIPILKCYSLDCIYS
ncbi:hypothetical protein XELAEV_18020665mg [Xenopus laevis]|uniref:Uncharacterized protein n=1 Tax=Xenopus laevis TaxID=8355 RepID=A0A974HQW0_XENLA|nr:hypothetical protein XELAEV_18020665mg [Xenopus laevis]